jgi:ketosteroid isomerase-like protein
MAENGRVGVVERALEAAVTGDAGALPELFTEDVSGWSPNMMVGSLAELTEAVAARDESLSDVSILIHGVDVVGDRAYAEYIVSAVFSGPFPIGDDIVIDPNGRELTLGGIIAADFAGDKISAFRNYFDDVTLLVQMLAE